ncbi:hypothetical protein KY5_8088c [Streptomyces formicae]|uniref:DoxX family protein n=1 Tax=Streptomyces formicae TaxID=1616117 RepID=A0A291QNH4_9ACTN|nr:hypothetical protein KY5_8088c [Streptomyces formicae]
MTRLLRAPRPVRNPETSDEEGDIPPPRWSLPTRIAFRFFLVYVVLFFLSESRIMYALVGVFGSELPVDAQTRQYHTVRPIVTWVAEHLLHVEAPLIEPVLSGDQAFFWVLALCWFLAALLVTVVWTALDRQRPHHETLFKWFFVVVRMCLAAQLFTFGFAKVFPLQMSLPLTRLVEPFGDFGMQNVLWTQVGSSQPYEILLGCAEVTAGLLLVVPRTALLGALLAAIEMTQVLVLNFTYQVPVKLFTFHLLLLSLILVAPHAMRLAAFFVSDQGVGPVARPQLFRTRRALRLALAGQLLFGGWLAASQVHEDWKRWDVVGTSGPKPPLYGIWNVVKFTSDGQDRPPLTTDVERWNRFIVDTMHPYQPGPVSSQRMDGSIVDYAATFAPAKRAIMLARVGDPAWSGRLTFARPTGDKLTLDGVLGKEKVHIELEKVDIDSFPISRDGTRWVQDMPYAPRLQPR